MDQELVEYLDRRFNQLRDEFRQEFRGELRQELRGVRDELGAEIAASAGELRQEFRAELRQELRGVRDELGAENAASAAETRRHFDVVAEQLMGKIQLVGEGVIGLDQKVDRLADEMRTEFQKVDRRFLHLEARVIAARG